MVLKGDSRMTTEQRERWSAWGLPQAGIRGAKLLIMALGLLLMAAPARAQTVVPAAYAGTAGNGGLRITHGINALTYQMQIAASQLGGIAVGERITGLSFRLDDIDTVGSPEISFADYEITLARAANAMGSMSANFAANMLNPAKVRDGAMTLAANSLPYNGVPESVQPFGSEIGFQTPYIYQGGDLIIHISHTGGSGDGAFSDAVGSGQPGYGSAFRALLGFSFQDATADNTSSAGFTITRLSHSAADAPAVPEPGSLLLFAAAGPALLLLRRRKTN